MVLNREWQTTMFGSNVYEDFDLHRSRSPIAFVSHVATPTLLVHGMEDVVAPPQQATEFYVALRHFGVPAELALYPREPHGFQGARTPARPVRAHGALAENLSVRAVKPGVVQVVLNLYRKDQEVRILASRVTEMRSDAHAVPAGGAKSGGGFPCA
ncbi:MAG: prolyl oligopeptidase family serine peptidase [Anaerolineae bacterium]